MPRPERVNQVLQETPQPQQPPVPYVARPKPRVQSAWMSVALLGAFICGGMGMTFVSGKAELARASYQANMLQIELRREQERNRQLSEEHARRINPASIETEAKKLGMARMGAKETLTVGEGWNGATE